MPGGARDGGHPLRVFVPSWFNLPRIAFPRTARSVTFAMAEALLQTDLPLPKRSGKVRDVYDLGDSLLIVATDRISAYDCVMPNGIPGKGKILTALSLFWFRLLADRVKNHLLATEVQEYPPHVRKYASQLEGRSM